MPVNFSRGRNSVYFSFKKLVPGRLSMLRWTAIHIWATLIGGLKNKTKQKDVTLGGGSRRHPGGAGERSARGYDQAHCLVVQNSQRIKKHTLCKSSWWTVSPFSSFIQQTNVRCCTHGKVLIPKDLRTSENQLWLVEPPNKGHTVSGYLIARSLKFKTRSPQNRNHPPGLYFISTNIQCPRAAWTQL